MHLHFIFVDLRKVLSHALDHFQLCEMIFSFHLSCEITSGDSAAVLDFTRKGISKLRLHIDQVISKHDVQDLLHRRWVGLVDLSVDPRSQVLEDFSAGISSLLRGVVDRVIVLNKVGDSVDNTGRSPGDISKVRILVSEPGGKCTGVRSSDDDPSSVEAGFPLRKERFLRSDEISKIFKGLFGREEFIILRGIERSNGLGITVVSVFNPVLHSFMSLRLLAEETFAWVASSFSADIKENGTFIFVEVLGILKVSLLISIGVQMIEMVNI